jgi:hypothetical protein
MAKTCQHYFTKLNKKPCQERLWRTNFLLNQRNGQNTDEIMYFSDLFKCSNDKKTAHISNQ